MHSQHEQEKGAQDTEIIPALRDLVQMAEYAGFSVLSRPDHVANLLLEWLVQFSAARGGALFMTAADTLTVDGFGGDSRQSKTIPMWRSTALHTMALHQMSDEEARLQLHALNGNQPANTRPGWLLYSLAITNPVLQTKHNSHINFPHDFSTVQSQIQAIQPLQLLILLKWKEKESGESATSIEHVRNLLGRLEHAIGLVIVNILLAEHVQALENAVAKKSLTAMELLKAELLATVSHELRSPLASIKGYTATLLRHERRISREERHEFLLAIQSGSDRLETIIDRLLEVSLLETDSIQLQPAYVNLARLIQESVMVVQQRIGANLPRGITFNLRLSNSLGQPTLEEPILMGDPRRLREVLDNILENAVKYSPGGGAIDILVRPVHLPLPAARSTARTRQAERKLDNAFYDDARAEQPTIKRVSGEIIEIIICDYGIGIPDEHLDRIFERFHRVDTSLTREFNGIGLGLTICKRIIDLHGGDIWAESCSAGGSAFHIWLPVQAEEEDTGPHD